MSFTHLAIVETKSPPALPWAHTIESIPALPIDMYMVLHFVDYLWVFHFQVLSCCIHFSS